MTRHQAAKRIFHAGCRSYKFDLFLSSGYFYRGSSTDYIRHWHHCLCVSCAWREDGKILIILSSQCFSAIAILSQIFKRFRKHSAKFTIFWFNRYKSLIYLLKLSFVCRKTPFWWCHGLFLPVFRSSLMLSKFWERFLLWALGALLAALLVSAFKRTTSMSCTRTRRRWRSNPGRGSLPGKACLALPCPAEAMHDR